MATTPKSAFDQAWDEVVKGSGTIVRVVGRDRVHLRTAGGLSVLFDQADVPAIEATLALLRGLGGKR
jgi:hypothetical protein